MLDDMIGGVKNEVDVVSFLIHFADIIKKWNESR